MKEVAITKFRCEICSTQYNTRSSAIECESRKVTQDKGAKAGDTVRILKGEGIGELAKVKSITTVNRDWGHYAWEKYWHTIALECDIIDGWGGTRFLTFDHYELV